MLVYRKGDIIQALKAGEINVLAHGCNLSGGFGSGIAGQIKKEFPEVAEEYFNRYKLYNLGGILSVNLKFSDLKIWNCFTQKGFGNHPPRKYVCYEAIYEIFNSITREMKLDENLIIGIPKIGAGLGGGNWKIIETIINETIKDEIIYCYTLE